MVKITDFKVYSAHMDITIKEQFIGMRLDAYLVEKYPDRTRAYLQKLIRAGDILVSGESVKTGCKLKKGDVISIEFPEPKTVDIQAEDIPLDILHEDEDIVVINKPAGLVVHPSDTGGHSTGSLVNALLFHCGDSLKGISGELRPGIVHRLDKDTSGVLVVAKTDDAHQFLSAQFKDRKVEKEYLTLVYGDIDPVEAVIDSPIGRSIYNRKKMAISSESKGRKAVTKYRADQVYSDDEGSYSLLKVGIETGRTHQIRVHMNAIGYPVVGDITYGDDKVNKHFAKKYDLKRQFLHAWKLSFVHPKTGKRVHYESNLPEGLEKVLDQLVKL